MGQHKIYASCFGHQRALAMAAVVRQLTASGGRSTDQILHNIFTDRRNWVDQGLDYAIYNWVFKDGAPALTSPN